MDNELVRLQRFIGDHHSLEEVRTLCFELGVRYDALGGEGLDAKTRELLLYLGRRRRLDDLLRVLEDKLPELFHRAGFSTEPAVVEVFYAALPPPSGAELSLSPAPQRQPTPWQLALRVLAVLSWMVATVWFWVEPGFEPLMAFLGGVAFFLGSFAAGEDEGAAARAVQEAAARNRRISKFLKGSVRVQIQDRLENSLHDAARLELGLAQAPGAVARPWAMSLERPGEAEKPLPPGTKIKDLFRRLGGAMLIRGAPGSGKTVTLLTLARQLLKRDEQDPMHPVPLLFNLASWGHKQLPLDEWLVEELDQLYHVDKKHAPGWLQSAAYTLLLDGLDEVAEAHREACVSAINRFHRESGFVQIAVCSRTAVYERLARKLHLGGAVTIQPLARKQVDEYLAAGGEQLAAARVAVNADALLQELAQTPLLLDVIALAYQGRSLEELASGTLRERRRHLFATYVQRMFERRGEVGEEERERAIHHLAWLSGRMSARTQKVFHIERLQPGWLDDLDDKAIFYQLAWGSAVGLGIALAIGLFGSWMTESILGLISWLLAGLLMGLSIGFLVALEIGREIETVENLNFSWKSALRGVFTLSLPLREHIRMIGIVLLVALLEGLSSGVSEGLRSGVSAGLRLGLAFSVLVLYWLLADAFVGVAEAVTYQESESRSVPNLGIRLSAANALRGGLILGLFGGPMGAILGVVALRVGFLVGGDLNDFLVGGLILGMVSGLAVGFFRYGGVAVIQHAILRLLLAHYDYLPLRLVDFLDDMATRILLRKVGGGYEFYHGMLLEYFARLEKDAGE